MPRVATMLLPPAVAEYGTSRDLVALRLQLRMRALQLRPERRQLGLRLRQRRAGASAGRSSPRRQCRDSAAAGARTSSSQRNPEIGELGETARRETPARQRRRSSPAAPFRHAAVRRCRRRPARCSARCDARARRPAPRPGVGLLGAEAPALDQTHAERVEIVRRDDARADRVAAVVVRQRQTRKVERRDRLEGGAVLEEMRVDAIAGVRFDVAVLGRPSSRWPASGRGRRARASRARRGRSRRRWCCRRSPARSGRRRSG